MRVLLIGGGGREHALAHFIANSKDLEKLYIAPGNAGIKREGELVDLDVSDHEAVLAFCSQNKIDLVVIGPEAPLVSGLADRLNDENIKVFGPSKAGALLEGSKAYAKSFMLKHDIPTAHFGSFDSLLQAQAYLDEHPGPIVVKANGLAAGKGVYVCENSDEAHAALEEIFSGKFGDAGQEVVIEEMLEGEECSFLIVRDEHTFLALPLAQDHKQIGEGDTGANTGGMGVYAPCPVSNQNYEAMYEIMKTVHEALIKEGISYRGVLYGGFMLTQDGPKVLEFNVRFGDPETQVILPLIKSDFLELLDACAKGELSSYTFELKDQVALCVILASEGYPGSYEKGKLIEGIDQAEALDKVFVYHAGTTLNKDGELITNGGRVLGVSALADNFKDAANLGYQACDLITFEGKYLRRDIGHKVLDK
ncbi:MAG: phosphoribosylamine--glycine ligase [Coriobacteriia bacterium]|nr:phosphoribosylamine--glycine ligase [Coriobacteriia bacterium]